MASRLRRQQLRRRYLQKGLANTGETPTRRAASTKPSGLLARAAVFDEKCARIFDRITHSFAAKFTVLTVGILSFVGLVATLYQITIDIEDRAADRIVQAEDRQARAEEREERLLGRIDRAKSLIRSRTSGDIGKGEAISFLLSQGVSLQFADLSCESIGGSPGEPLNSLKIAREEVIESPTGDNCDRANILSNIQMAEKTKKGGLFYLRAIRDVNLSGSRVRLPYIDGVHFGEANFTHATVEGGAIRDSDLSRALVTRLSIYSTDLSGSMIQPWGMRHLQFNNISGAAILSQSKPDAFDRNFFSLYDPPRCTRKNNRLLQPENNQDYFLRNASCNWLWTESIICGPTTYVEIGRQVFQKTKIEDRALENAACSLILDSKIPLRPISIAEAIEHRPRLFSGSWRPHP